MALDMDVSVGSTPLGPAIRSLAVPLSSCPTFKREGEFLASPLAHFFPIPRPSRYVYVFPVRHTTYPSSLPQATLESPNMLIILLGLLDARLSLGAALGIAHLDAPQPFWSEDNAWLTHHAYGIVEELISHPNATGSFPIAGIDISELYDSTHSPPGRLIEGWSWEISVRADVPYAWKNTTSSASSTDFMTMSRTVLKSPDSFVGNASTFNVSYDWALCLIQWHFDDHRTSEYPTQLFSDDGSCSSILSSQCIEALQHPTTKSDPSLAGCMCPDLWDIAECHNDAPSLHWAVCSSKLYAPMKFNEIFRNGSSWEVAWNWDQPAKAARNLTSYNLVGGMAWPLLLRFLPDSNHNQPGSYGVLSCPRATNATHGNVVPDGTKALPASTNPTSTTTFTPPSSGAARATTEIWGTIIAFLIWFMESFWQM